MPYNAMEPVIQPFMKLTQANMDLWARFSTRAFEPTAFAEFMQGLVKNNTEFFLELGQSGQSVLRQSQAVLMRGAQDASVNVRDATQGRDGARQGG
jgi:hypothetical protein